eukprot:2461482-Rhodomonas_salina.5
MLRHVRYRPTPCYAMSGADLRQAMPCPVLTYSVRGGARQWTRGTPITCSPSATTAHAGTVLPVLASRTGIAYGAMRCPVLA